ncbi:MAG: hypothetical protein HY959_03795 [Ignavibacteriae bacterium]|nr:hypothetical protein [Ignavibacteriota bacterium]
MSKKNFKNLITGIPMKISLKTIMESLDSLILLGQKEGLGVVTQWKLVPIIKKARNEYQSYTEISNQKIKELGEKVLDGNKVFTGRYKVKPENEEKYKKEIEKLLKQEIEIDVPLITYSELKGNNETFSLPTNVLVDLDWLIKQG